MEKNNIIYNDSLLGFSSIKDYFKTIIGTDYLSIIGFTTVIGFINGFISKYIYESPEAIYTLLGLLLLDVITGVAKAIKYKTFSSSKLSRCLLITFTYIILLAISFHLSKSTILFVWLPSTLYFGFTSVLLVSVIENLTILKLLPTKILNKILDKLK